MRIAIIAAVIVTAISTAPSTLRAQDAEFKVVVNPSVSVSEISAAELSKIFLKQGTYPGGSAAAPIEPAKGNPVRASFAKKVHGRATNAIEAYWQNQVFSGGESPPPTKSSDEDIIAAVKSTAGGIGYVSAGSSTAGVKVVAIK
jgi:ABC-type phosphate transport system substrate-binding protein